MKEVNETEVEVKVVVEDKLDAVTMGEVQISSTTVMRKEKAQQENLEEAIQAQGMINLKPDAITVQIYCHDISCGLLQVWHSSEGMK